MTWKSGVIFKFRIGFLLAQYGNCARRRITWPIRSWKYSWLRMWFCFCGGCPTKCLWNRQFLLAVAMPKMWSYTSLKMGPRGKHNLYRCECLPVCLQWLQQGPLPVSQMKLGRYLLCPTARIACGELPRTLPCWCCSVLRGRKIKVHLFATISY